MLEGAQGTMLDLDDGTDLSNTLTERRGYRQYNI